MESVTNEVAHHTPDEISNFYATQDTFQQWVKSTDWPSLHVLRDLHRNLLLGISEYQSKGAVPRQPGEFRKEDLSPPNESDNFYVRGTDVDPTIRSYAKDLDVILTKLPEAPNGNISTVIHDAAWAYYTFIRIHPFLDGNGRTGRFILNRVLVGSGLSSLRFVESDPIKERDRHLDAMEAVDRTMNLTHLELYLLDKIYKQTADDTLRSEISRVYTEKLNTIQPNNGGNHQLEDIWAGFNDLDIEKRTQLQERIAS